MKYDIEEFGKGQIIAHRGDWGKGAPENSLKAFERAVEKGLDIELDVHLTLDGSLAVFHDFSLLRMSFIPWLVSLLTKKQLKKTKLRLTDQHIPTLEEVLALVKDKVTIFLELKSMFGYKKLCDKIVDALKNYEGKIVFIGFNAKALKYLQSKDLYPVAVSSFRYIKRYKDFSPNGVCVNIGGLIAAKAQKEDYKAIFSWTINSDKMLETAKKYSHAYIVNTRNIPSLAQKNTDK